VTAEDLRRALDAAKRCDTNVEVTWPDAEVLIAQMERAERIEEVLIAQMERAERIEEVLIAQMERAERIEAVARKMSTARSAGHVVALLPELDAALQAKP
jgi:hypothetical protein